MAKKANVEIKPVAWSDGKVTMYQGFASWQASKDRTIQLIGDPFRTEIGAFQKLKEEWEIRSSFLGIAWGAIKEYENKTLNKSDNEDK